MHNQIESTATKSCVLGLFLFGFRFSSSIILLLYLSRVVPNNNSKKFTDIIYRCRWRHRKLSTKIQLDDCSPFRFPFVLDDYGQRL